MPDSACSRPAVLAVLTGALCASADAADAVAGVDAGVVAVVGAAAVGVAGLSQAASATAAAMAAIASGGNDGLVRVVFIASPRPAIMAQSVDRRRRLAHRVARRRGELRQRDPRERDRGAGDLGRRVAL